MAGETSGDRPTAETPAAREDIPLRFLLAILNDLRRAGIVESRRGHGGGYRLARPVDEITLAEVIEAVDPTLGERPWMRPATMPQSATRTSVQQVWLTLRANGQQVLETTTIADILSRRDVTDPGWPAPVEADATPPVEAALPPRP